MTSFGSKENHFYGSLLYADPKIIWCKTWSISERVDGETHINPIVKEFANVEVIWLVSFGWLASDFVCKEIIDGVRSVSAKHKVVFLVNSYEEVSILRRKNIVCMLVNQNQFLNKNEFCIVDNTPKKYNAVYNAGFYEYKRHFLAEKVRDLALLSRGVGNAEILNAVRGVEGVNLLNYNHNNYRWMGSKEINLIYNESRCGLCLSKTEGAMKACMEYLLSGIPVVTTVNKGGRDYFLDGRFTIWVEDDPDSVLHAVSWFSDSSISPEFIRQETLRKLLQANEMFIQELSAAFSLNVNDLRSRLMQDDFNISRERPVDEL
jgi:glycosyltransferase involved in cell wall biosynthesis